MNYAGTAAHDTSYAHRGGSRGYTKLSIVPQPEPELLLEPREGDETGLLEPPPQRKRAQATHFSSSKTPHIPGSQPATERPVSDVAHWELMALIYGMVRTLTSLEACC